MSHHRWLIFNVERSLLRQRLSSKESIFQSVTRPHYTIEDIIQSKLGFNFERIEKFEPFGRVPNFNLTWWAKYLPDIIEPAMIDMISLLQRLGYNPTRTDIEQYETKDLAPRKKFIRNIFLI